MDDGSPAAVVNVTPAVNLVTQAEFKATIGPMKDDITEIKGDVKTLLAAKSGRDAVTGIFKHATASATALSAGLVGALAAHFLR